MLTLEITIQRRTAESWPLVAEQLQPGLLPTRSEGVLTLNQTALLAQLTPRAYGTALGQAIFQGQIRDAFAGALAESAEGIRLLLFVEADDLRQLRWERLCAPFQQGQATHWDFLTLNHRTLFSLYLPSLTDRRYPPIGRRDLRALVLIASPNGLTAYGLQPFDATAAATQVQAALGAIPFDLLASGSTGAVPNAVGPASLTALCQRLTDTYYTLVHVVCHGAYDHKSGETSLFLADNEHQLDRIEGTRLLDQLGRLRGRRGLPHLAFLATCESAAPAAEGALGGLAQRLVRDLGMPAVIAMTEKVSLLTVQLLTSGFYAQLQATGEVDRALVEAAIAVAERSDATVPAIYSRLGSQPLFSRAVARELTATELAYGLDLLGPLLAARAPTLAPTFTQAATILRRTLQLDVASLDHAAQQERLAALDEVATITAKATDLSFKALSQGDPPPAYDARCPFRGLVAFGVADQAFFFGREALVAQIVMRLAQSPFLALLGPSGSGKSSLVLAGVIPALQKQTPTLAVQIITPGADPVTALATAHTVLAAQPTAHAALLVIDQFEESFTLCSDGARRQAFFQQIFALVAPSDRATLGQPSAPLTVMLTMRADFWGDCASYPQLRDWLLAQQLLIGPMTASELRSAMEQQAGVVGLRFEADLANTILDDVAGEPGAMPLLQHGLRELWQRRYGRWLVAAEYREMGGIKRAIAHSADAIYDQLPAAQQAWMRLIFVRLTRVDQETLPGQERRDTRQRVTFAELLPIGVDPTSLTRLIAQLADARLVVSDYNAITGQNEIEVAHEALIRQWPRLQTWISEDAEGIRMQRQIAGALDQWQANHQEPSYLFRGQRLRLVQDWARENANRLNEQEQAFVAASSQRERLGRWRAWGTRITIVLLPLLVAIGIMWVGRIGLFADPDIVWRHVDELAGGAQDVIWDAAGVMYASFTAGAPNAVAVSRDQGVTWQHISLPVTGVGPLAADPFVPGQVYAVAENDTLWGTDDGGAQWRQFPFSAAICDIAVSTQRTLYITVGSDYCEELYMSHDFGASWEAVAGGPGTETYFITWGQDQLLLSREDGLWTWTPAAGWQQPFELDVAWISGVVQAQNTLWLSTSAGLYRQVAGAEPEQITPERFNKLALLAVAPAVIVAASDKEVRWFPVDGSAPQTIGSSTELRNAQRIQRVRANANQPNSLWITADTGLFFGDPAAYLAE